KDTTPLPSVKKTHTAFIYIASHDGQQTPKRKTFIGRAFHSPLTCYFPTTIAQKAGPLVAVQNSSSYRPYLSLMARWCSRSRSLLQALPELSLRGLSLEGRSEEHTSE